MFHGFLTLSSMTCTIKLLIDVYIERASFLNMRSSPTTMKCIFATLTFRGVWFWHWWKWFFWVCEEIPCLRASNFQWVTDRMVVTVCC